MAGFVINTPAHNDEAFVDKSIASMLLQSERLGRWIIVSTVQPIEQR
jgi:hypothetical protein